MANFSWTFVAHAFSFLTIIAHIAENGRPPLGDVELDCAVAKVSDASASIPIRHHRA